MCVCNRQAWLHNKLCGTMSILTYGHLKIIRITYERYFPMSHTNNLKLVSFQSTFFASFKAKLYSLLLVTLVYHIKYSNPEYMQAQIVTNLIFGGLLSYSNLKISTLQYLPQSV